MISAYRDRRLWLCVAFPKITTELWGSNCRVFECMTNRDFHSRSEPVPVLVRDLRADALAALKAERVREMLDVPINPAYLRTEICGVGVYPRESCTLTFPWMMTFIGVGRLGPHDGPSELQLACSRDLPDWQRHFREPVVPPGASDEWDSGWFYSASEVLRFGYEVRLYYAVGNLTHGTPATRSAAFEDGTPTGQGEPYTCSIALATWSRDRFVSVDAESELGTLTTVPLKFSGQRLKLNVATRGDGAIAVKLLNLQGEVVARSQHVRGDDLSHQVYWQGEMDLGVLAEQAVLLRSPMRKAELHSFAFRSREDH